MCSWGDACYGAGEGIQENAGNQLCNEGDFPFLNPGA